ncbi:MAG: PilZ domain-containing protein [Proteobacteria bacterium]|nr:PilZ domain-containing protein [Pseudomonadota bacterium]
MFSIKGIYENGAIQLLEPLPIEGDTDVIITFLDDEPQAELGSGDKVSNPDEIPSSVEIEDEQQTDEYYEKFRKHKRYQAKGIINLISDEENDESFPLNDYSAGGLSFISERPFEVNKVVTASLKYVAAGEVLEMKFEIEVKRLIGGDTEKKIKVGCQFLDNVDEELWHMIMD